jgi:cobalt/nickel transport system permease protein
MHISEGVLSVPVLIGGAAAAGAGTVIGLRQIDAEEIMPTALLTSAFFSASLIHVPLGPGSAHLLLSGLVGLVLGWACFPAILTGLFLQAVFFQFGGLTALGVNTATAALPALCCHYLARPWLARPRLGPAAAFFAGALAILLTALLTAFALALSDNGFAAAAKAVVIAHVPLMLIEGLITMSAVVFIAKVQPQALRLKEA